MTPATGERGGRLMLEIVPPEPKDTPDRDVNRVLWLALVAALTTFLRVARRELGMKHGEQCPRCGNRF